MHLSNCIEILDDNDRDVFIFNYFQRVHPNPEPFLWATTAFSWLVAVVLSAQTTDLQVNKVLAQGLTSFDTPEKMLQLDYDALLARIRTVGLAPRKAKHILELSRMLVHHHGGQVPNSREQLMTLPGVGRKTANVVLNHVFGQCCIAVDTHVFRVARRLGLSQAHRPEGVEQDLEKLKAPHKKNLSSWLILHGRTYCLARNPRCEACPLRQACAFFQGQRTS